MAWRVVPEGLYTNLISKKKLKATYFTTEPRRQVGSGKLTGQSKEEGENSMQGALGCGTCTQNLSALKRNCNLPLNPRSGKSEEWGGGV